MRIDAFTLMVAGGFVSAVGSVLLCVAWLQFRSAPAILWWAAAFFINALAVAALAPGFDRQEPALVLVGAALVPLAATAIWAGTRVFRGRKLRWWALAAVPVTWLASGLLPLPAAPRSGWLLATMALSAGLFMAAMVELWLGRAEKLPSRWPLLGVIGLHAFICVLGVADVASRRITPDVVPPLTIWFSLIYFELFVFLLGSAVFIVMMTRERADIAFVTAARTDALTGVANRGALFDRAERMYRRAQEGGTPISLALFDLDRFKLINDTYGHGAGDLVLRAFAETATALLRPIDLLGRIGGEEFAALLPGADSEAAYVIADRVRRAFGAMPKFSGSVPIHATVSVGVATASPGGALETLFEAADRALYRAKAFGRDRVERGVDTAPPAPGPDVSRVA